jgi:hypothetical protein
LELRAFEQGGIFRGVTKTRNGKKNGIKNGKRNGMK